MRKTLRDDSFEDILLELYSIKSLLQDEEISAIN